MKHLRTFVKLLVFVSLTGCASYKSLHKNSIVIDMHNDALSNITTRDASMEEEEYGNVSQTNIQRLKLGGVNGQFFSIFCDPQTSEEVAFQKANQQIDSITAIVSRNRDKMLMTYNPSQLKIVTDQKKIAVMLGIEGGHVIASRLDYLDVLYKRGARYMSLTWDNSNSLGTSALDEADPSSKLKKGLTEFGKSVVARMNELGMIVDVSHVGKKTFYDILEVTKKPVIASHSNVDALCPSLENLTDGQIQAIAKNGGVIHINFYSGDLDPDFEKRKLEVITEKKADSILNTPEYTKDSDKYLYSKYPDKIEYLRADPKWVIKHIDYIVKLVGIDHVALGSDYGGVLFAAKDLENVSKFPKITEMLRKKGYSKNDVRKILSGNLLRLWEANAPL